MEPVSKFHKGSGSLFLLVALAGALAACLPKPDEPIEWLQRADAVIIQKKTVNDASSELEQRLTVPEFTLYGDGTLIYERKRGIGYGLPILEAELSEEAIRGLLESIVDEGFLEFAYDQPRRASAVDVPTTYLYVQTKAAANAVSAYGLGFELPEDAGKEWDQFRRIEKIARRLDEFDPSEWGASAEGEFVPEAGLLLVQRAGEADEDPGRPAWPVPEVSLAGVAPPDGDVGETHIEGALAGRLAQLFSLDEAAVYREDDGLFVVGFDQVLPYEEHFPEFDRPPEHR